MLGGSRYLLRVAGQPYLLRDPCSEISRAGLSKKRGKDPLLRVAGQPYLPRDPLSAISGAGLSKKRVEDPLLGDHDPCHPPPLFRGERERGLLCYKSRPLAIYARYSPSIPRMLCSTGFSSHFSVKRPEWVPFIA